MKKLLFLALYLLAAVPVLAQQTRVNIQYDPQRNTEGILPFSTQVLSPEVRDDHTVISYAGLEPYYEQTDFYADSLWDMYSTCHFTMADANKPQKYVCDGWNKEHLVCQSWLGSGPMVSDLFNVYPTDARINNLRSNYPYGVVSGGFSGFSGDPQHHGKGKLGSSTTSGIGTCYEPDDEYKGDFARSFFYMVARTSRPTASLSCSPGTVRTLSRRRRSTVTRPCTAFSITAIRSSITPNWPSTYGAIG